MKLGTNPSHVRQTGYSGNLMASRKLNFSSAETKYELLQQKLNSLTHLVDMTIAMCDGTDNSVQLDLKYTLARSPIRDPVCRVSNYSDVRPPRLFGTAILRGLPGSKWTLFGSDDRRELSWLSWKDPRKLFIPRNIYFDVRPSGSYKATSLQTPGKVFGQTSHIPPFNHGTRLAAIVAAEAATCSIVVK